MHGDKGHSVPHSNQPWIRDLLLRSATAVRAGYPWSVFRLSDQRALLGLGEIIQSSDQHYRRLMMGFGAAAELLASGLDSDR